jgi:hypothetical protein
MNEVVERPCRRPCGWIRVGLLVAAAGFVVAGTAGAQTRGSSAVAFGVGTWTAKTSQAGAAFRFKVEAHSASNHCGTAATTRCFIDLSTPPFTQPCKSGGEPIKGPFPIPNATFASNTVSYVQAADGYNPLVLFKGRFVGNKATGTMRVSELVDNAGTTETCDSGTVHWTARLVG